MQKKPASARKTYPDPTYIGAFFSEAPGGVHQCDLHWSTLSAAIRQLLRVFHWNPRCTTQRCLSALDITKGIPHTSLKM